MDFRSVNNFNRMVNILSANFFPMTGEKTGMGIIRAFAMSFIWTLKMSYIIATAIGCSSYIPAFIAVRDGGVYMIDSIEIITLSLWMNLRRDDIHEMIRKINSILVQCDDMRRLLGATVDPMKNRMKIYTVSTLITTFLWCFLPILKIFETDTFTYTDFVLPTYFPGEPFNAQVFIFGIVLDTIAGTYVFFNKNAIDIYVSYMVTILTAEFRYINEQVTKILARSKDVDDDDSVIDDLRKCVESHCVAIEAGQVLTKLLYPNAAVTYLNCVLRFCFIAFGLSVTKGAYVAKTIYVLFTIGNFVQVYFFCSCIQDLLEASSSITEDAFYEDWHGRGHGVKNFFHTMGLSNKIEIRVSAFGVVDLTVPSFAAILNHAYSGYLLLVGVTR